MIRVEYSRKGLWVSVEGHAESGPFGQDLVCAAVSSLAVTLGESIRAMEKEGKLKNARRELDAGSARLSCEPKYRFRKEAVAVFETVIRGLSCLGWVYPRFIVCREQIDAADQREQP